MNSGVLKVESGWWGDKAPPLAARPDARPLPASQCGSLYPDPFSQPPLFGRRDTDHLPQVVVVFFLILFKQKRIFTCLFISPDRRPWGRNSIHPREGGPLFVRFNALFGVGLRWLRSCGPPLYLGSLEILRRIFLYTPFEGGRPDESVSMIHSGFRRPVTAILKRIEGFPYFRKKHLDFNWTSGRGHHAPTGPGTRDKTWVDIFGLKRGESDGTVATACKLHDKLLDLKSPTRVGLLFWRDLAM